MFVKSGTSVGGDPEEREAERAREAGRPGGAAAAERRCRLSRRPSTEATHSSAPIRGALGARAVGGARAHQTFATAARPRRPLGRRIITAIRITKTIASEKVEET